jgi:hypothetical protein
VLFVYQTATTWPGLIIILTGVPVYFIWRKVGVPMAATADDDEFATAADRAGNG